MLTFPSIHFEIYTESSPNSLMFGLIQAASYSMCFIVIINHMIWDENVIGVFNHNSVDNCKFP